MIRLKYIVPATVLFGALVGTATLSLAKPEYTKKEKKGCVFCHKTATSKDLNKTGECYGKNKSLEGCATEKKKKE